MLVVDFRTLGWVLPRQSVSSVAREAQTWLVWSLLAMFLTGVPLMASLAYSKYYQNGAFRLKMLFLAAAIGFTFTIRKKLALGAPEESDRSSPRRPPSSPFCSGPGSGSWGAGSGFTDRLRDQASPSTLLVVP